MICTLCNVHVDNGSSCYWHEQLLHKLSPRLPKYNGLVRAYYMLTSVIRSPFNVYVHHAAVFVRSSEGVNNWFNNCCLHIHDTSCSFFSPQAERLPWILEELSWAFTFPSLSCCADTRGGTALLIYVWILVLPLFILQWHERSQHIVILGFIDISFASLYIKVTLEMSAQCYFRFQT